jgi:hypothetical protein
LKVDENDETKKAKVVQKIAETDNLEEHPEIIVEMEQQGLVIRDGAKTHTEREEDTKWKESMKVQVEALRLDATKAKNLLTGLYVFYDEHSLDDKEKLNFTLERDGIDIVMKKNERKIKIDLENATLP